MSKNPIIPQNFACGINVVDIGDIRVARGLTRREFPRCPHQAMMYDDKERRVWCSDCETEVEPFDAFKRLVEMHAKAQRVYAKMREEALAAQQANITRIACKNLQKEWASNRTIPACPSCNTGLLPDDFKGRIKTISKALELQRRKSHDKDEV